MTKSYRGFTDDNEYYYVGEHKFKIKTIGYKINELKEDINKLKEKENTSEFAELEKQFCMKCFKYALEGCDYDFICESFGVPVAIGIAGEVYGFLSVFGNPKEAQRLKIMSEEIQKQSTNTPTL